MSSSTTQATWTRWYDDRSPNADGDSELTEAIQKEYGKICDKNYDISGTECQLNANLVFNDSSPASYVPNKLFYFCTRDGVWCRNKDQVNSTCGDYAIRYRCKYSGSSSTNDSAMLPQFDVRIYIILAVVPILIFIARVLWTYIFRNRRQRRREERRARRRQQGRYDDDESSAAKPPPSYHDIFGEPGHLKTSVFAISRNNLPICQTCRGLPCSVARVIDSAGSRRSQKGSPRVAPDADTAPGVDTTTNSGVISQQELPQSDVADGNTTQVTAEEGSSTLQVRNSVQFTEIDLSSPSTSAAEPAWISETMTEVNELSPPIPDASGSPSSPQHVLKQNTSVSITMSPSKLHAESISISQPCPCACHRTIPFSHYGDLGYDNSAFTSEVDLAHPFPGMHVPPISGLQRAWSNISVITLSELPSYEAALELMNKETKEANEVKVETNK